MYETTPLHNIDVSTGASKASNPSEAAPKTPQASEGARPSGACEAAPKPPEALKAASRTLGAP